MARKRRHGQDSAAVRGCRVVSIGRDDDGVVRALVTSGRGDEPVSFTYDGAWLTTERDSGGFRREALPDVLVLLWDAVDEAGLELRRGAR